MNEAATPFADELAAFFTYMRSEKQFSPLTQENYQRDLEKFCRFCAKYSLNDLAAIQPQHIRQGVAALHRSGLGGKSLQRFRSLG